MNESFGTDRTEVLDPRLQLAVPDTFDNEDPDTERESPIKPHREGLPTSFRMRHDKHYVEELMSPTTIAREAPPAPSPRPPVSATAVEFIASRLESIVAYDAISRGQGPADRVARTLQADLQRVSRFARAVAISADDREPVRRSVTAGELAVAIRSACTRVVRVDGMDCVVTTDEGGFAVALNRALVVQGVAGTVDALLDLKRIHTDDSVDEGGTITVSLQAAKVRPALIVDITCPMLAWRGGPPDRFFDNDARDFAGAPAAGTLLASAAHVARLHGGRVEVQMQGGVSVRYVFPQETAGGSRTLS